MEVNIARDFDPYPWGREQGRDFRERILKPKLRPILSGSGERLTVDLDGCRMLGSSFLEEAFGGLVRHRVIDKHDFNRVIVLKASSPSMRLFVDAIHEYVKKARAG